MLQILNYEKSYSKAKILAFEELRLESGIYLLQGINGSGKTTLMQSVAGIVNFEGSVTIDDVSLKKSPIEYRKLVSYSEAEPKFPQFLSGKELLQFVGKTCKASKAQITNLTSLMDIEHYWDNPVQTYSSGMLKKVSLCMALIGDPALILLDEPFTTIDLKTTEQVCSIIRKRSEKGVTFIISAHQIKETIPLQFNRTLKVEHRTLTFDP